MKTAMQRKEFLRLSLFGVIATLIPINEIKALSSVTKNKNFNFQDNQTALEIAAQAKDAFYNKDYATAENLYLQCIDLAPVQIQYYDCLQNVYAVLKKDLQIVQLFKNGLDANPSIVAFYDRLANALIRVELGNKSILTEVHNIFGEMALFDKAIELYNSAIILDDKAYLQNGLNKVNYLISIQANTLYAHNNETLKSNKKINKELYASRYDSFTNQELLDLISIIDSKIRNELFTTNDIQQRAYSLIKEKKRIYKTIDKRFYELKDYNNAVIYSKLMYELDKTDSNAMRSLGKLYEKIEDYYNLVELKREWHFTKNDLWSKLGLISALDKAYQNTNNNANITEAISLASQLLDESNTLSKNDLSFKTALKLAKLYRVNNDFTNALAIYNTNLNSDGLKPYQLHKLSIGYIKTISKSGDKNKAKKLLKLALKQDNYVGSQDEIMINNVTANMKPSTRLMFEYELYNLFEEEGDNQNQQKTLKRILRNNPEDKFVKRVSKDM